MDLIPTSASRDGSLLVESCLGRLPTRALLSARGIQLPLFCPACDVDKETIEHVLFICPRARQVWMAVGLDFILSHSVDLVAAFLDLLRSPFASSSFGFPAYVAYHI